MNIDETMRVLRKKYLNDGDIPTKLLRSAQLVAPM